MAIAGTKRAPEEQGVERLNSLLLACALEFIPLCGVSRLRPRKTALGHLVSSRRAMPLCKQNCCYYRF